MYRKKAEREGFAFYDPSDFLPTSKTMFLMGEGRGDEDTIEILDLANRKRGEEEPSPLL